MSHQVSHEVLLVTRDEGLAGHVGRLAAVAGVELGLAAEPARGFTAWSRARLVLVGADLAPTARTAGLPRRASVHVLCRGPAPDSLFRDALVLGAAGVAELPDANSWLAGLLADVGDGSDRPGTTLAVVGAGGGAGATMLTAALAVEAGRDIRKRAGAGRPGPAHPPHEVAVVDLDPLGPGLARVLGSERREAVTWSDLAATRGRLGARALREALGSGAPAVLGWGPDAGAPRALPTPDVLREVVDAARRGFDLVALDLPRTEVDSLVPLLRPERVVVVLRAGVAAVAAAAELLGRVRALDVPAGLVVRGGSAQAAVVADVLGAPVLASVPAHRALDEHLDLGLGPARTPRAPWARGARAVLLSLPGPSDRSGFGASPGSGPGRDRAPGLGRGPEPAVGAGDPIGTAPEGTSPGERSA